ncbi:MAG: alpha-2-macroglobulin family protein, partial [Myxococcota bacterium]
EPQVQIGQVFGFDTQVLPAGLTVAGRSASELLSTEDPAAREQLARLLFASAGDVAAPNFNYNSLAEELPQVISSMTTRVARDGENIIQSLGEMAERGFVTEENVVSMIGRMKVVDPFGRWYRLSVTETEWGGQELSIASDGPDELRDTRDDVEVKTDLFRAFYSRRAGVDDADFTGAGGPQVENAAAPPAPEAVPGEKAEATTVRADFRETALVNPTLVTDQNGRATVTFRLPDSITTWRASADGSTALGRIGSTQHRFRTFQDFFVDFSMPTELTAGDVLELPAVVYNYTDAATTVTVAMDDAPWFDLLSAPEEVVTLGPSEVRSVKFRLEVREAGEHALTVRGSGMGIADALVRSVRVDPDGQPENETFSGQVDGNATHVVTIPGDTVPNGARVEVALTPGFAAEAVQGLASMVKEPNGCFEQTTSTAWPNTLVANYLETTGQMTPEMREDIVGTVTRGYQRLLTFESPTGGINWWGNDNPEPGNRILSAIMLWHLKDLEPLIEIDTAFRDRLLDWLLSQQNADGSWDAGDALHSGNESLGTSEARTTGFIAWALAHTGWADEAVRRAAGWLGANVPTEADLYANALVANAMVLAEPGGATTNMLLGRLDTMRIDLEAGSVWHSDEPSWTGSAGDMAAVETTGLVAYGLMNAQAYPEGAAGAMRYIVSSKDSVGTWYNTQATMNALRALSAAASPMGSDAEGTLTLVVNGQTAHTIEVTRDNGDLLRTFDVTEFVQGGANDIELRMVGTGEVSYRLTRTAYRPGLPGSEGPFDLTVEYDRTQTTVGAPVTVTASARNNDRQVQNQVMVRVGRAPGFEPRYEDLDALVAAGAVARYEVRADDVTFYLMNVAPGETRPLQFRLTPGLAVEATAPASTIYSYYEPTLRQTVDAQRFTVTGGGAPGR